MSNVASGQYSFKTATRTAVLPGEPIRGSSGGGPGNDGELAKLRDDTCAMLHELDETAKARASVVRACSEMRSLSAAEVEALKDLLRCITDQRKRMRAVRRLWQSLDAFERPSAELVEATDLCFTECRELATALDPLRTQTIRQVHSGVAMTWTRLLKAATQFTL